MTSDGEQQKPDRVRVAMMVILRSLGWSNQIDGWQHPVEKRIRFTFDEAAEEAAKDLDLALKTVRRISS